MFDKIYDSAVKAAKLLKKNQFHRRLLNSKAFGDVTFGATGETKQLLSEAGEFLEPTSVCDKEQKEDSQGRGIHKVETLTLFCAIF